MGARRVWDAGSERVDGFEDGLVVGRLEKGLWLRDGGWLGVLGERVAVKPEVWVLGLGRSVAELGLVDYDIRNKCILTFDLVVNGGFRGWRVEGRGWGELVG